MISSNFIFFPRLPVYKPTPAGDVARFFRCLPALISKFCSLFPRALTPQVRSRDITVTSRPKRRVTGHNDPRRPAFGGLSRVTAASAAFACGPAPVTPLNGIFGGPAGPRAAFRTGWSRSPPVAPLFGQRRFVSGRSHPKPPAGLVGKLQYMSYPFADHVVVACVFAAAMPLDHTLQPGFGVEGTSIVLHFWSRISQCAFTGARPDPGGHMHSAHTSDGIYPPFSCCASSHRML